MSTDGTWGSHMEIQAAAQLLQVNFAIHQVGQPRWELMGQPNHPVFYHLSVTPTPLRARARDPLSLSHEPSPH